MIICVAILHASFKNILVQLHEIHEKGYVHSDIRLQNVVFGETSKLIDFDLADKEGLLSTIIIIYQSTIIGHELMVQDKKIHDVFGLNMIMQGFSFPEILEKYKNGVTLLEIAQNYNSIN